MLADSNRRHNTDSERASPVRLQLFLLSFQGGGRGGGRKRAIKPVINNTQKKKRKKSTSEESEPEDEEVEPEEGDEDVEDESDEEKNGSDGNKSDSEQSKDVPKHYHVIMRFVSVRKYVSPRFRTLIPVFAFSPGTLCC